MKIIVLNGSHRKNGTTAAILNELCRKLKEYPDAQVALYHVADMHLHYCAGCEKCYKTGKCIFEDDIEKLSVEMANADGLIIGSPTYAGDVSGQIKTIIDRGHFVIEQLLYRKYALSVVTYENYGGADAARSLHKLFRYSGAKISGTILHKSAFSLNPLLNIGTKENIQKAAEKFYRDIRKQRPYFLQTFIHSLIFMVGIRPFVQKRGEAYAGVLRHWTDRNIAVK